MLRQSRHLLIFLIRLMGTWDFWFLFLSTLTCVLMMAWRSSIRDDIFKMAQKSLGRAGW